MGLGDLWHFEVTGQALYCYEGEVVPVPNGLRGFSILCAAIQIGNIPTIRMDKSEVYGVFKAFWVATRGILPASPAFYLKIYAADLFLTTLTAENLVDANIEFWKLGRQLPGTALVVNLYGYSRLNKLDQFGQPERKLYWMTVVP